MSDGIFYRALFILNAYVSLGPQRHHTRQTEKTQDASSDNSKKQDIEDDSDVEYVNSVASDSDDEAEVVMTIAFHSASDYSSWFYVVPCLAFSMCTLMSLEGQISKFHLACSNQRCLAYLACGNTVQVWAQIIIIILISNPSECEEVGLLLTGPGDHVFRTQHDQIQAGQLPLQDSDFVCWD